MLTLASEACVDVLALLETCSYGENCGFPLYIRNNHNCSVVVLLFAYLLNYVY